jgi:hypothetical protein
MLSSGIADYYKITALMDKSCNLYKRYYRFRFGKCKIIKHEINLERGSRDIQFFLDGQMTPGIN